MTTRRNSNQDREPTTPSLDGSNSFASNLAVTPDKAKRRKRSRVPWTLVNFWVDTSMLIVFLALLWVSTVIRFVFPAASVADGWSLWGLGIDAWMEFHFVLFTVLSFGILVHLMLHWSWVCGVFFSRLRRKANRAKLPDDGTRTIYGVGFMIFLLNVLGLMIAAAAISVRSPR